MWLPSGPASRGDALDFAERVVLQASVVFAEYENVKRTYKDTDQVCEAQGFAFSPMIAEAHSGAWSLAARKMFDFITEKAAAAASSYTNPELESLRFAQRSSTTLQRENARAIARRMAGAPDALRDSGWDLWAE